MANQGTIKVSQETLELLRKVRKEKGVVMTEAIRIAVTDYYYGQKNSK